jgi:hypothetical protein
MAVKKRPVDVSDKQIESIYDSGKEATVNFIKTLMDKINDLAEIVEK